ncbi:rhomboid family intramembrane serine protease [Rhodocaloribacter litoris]|uniref:rhomboid family intramembrane serine protease n=1 Tax=Rhodocaloribacter litoris TaxID=2558931 RepID=UPI00142155D7|nr:rhomboid family intramembrane serine protease [Rhodocaloribacter litoris]QXD14705.1 rhomboid family intramembrane serine protease [Rhodocaloribacter litoris]GIV59204.1 MAG: rhomboid family intramembrane serine protease [Rhodothermaceae bacterium]
MLFPIGDDDRKLTRPAYVTTGLILANLAVFFLLQQAGANAAFTYGWSVIPWEITRGEDLVRPVMVRLGAEAVSVPQAPGPSPIYLTILTAMFMHGGYMHLFGNLIYLWIFGDNVEHRFGSGVFLLFYLVSGVAATFTQIALDPQGVVPNLGASGAISGVLGAYLVLFPRNRVYAIFMFFYVVSVPAVVAIGLWIVLQFINGWGAIMLSEQTLGGVAYGAHIGGFFAGVLLALVLRRLVREERPHVFSAFAAREGARRYW